MTDSPATRRTLRDIPATPSLITSTPRPAADPDGLDADLGIPVATEYAPRRVPASQRSASSFAPPASAERPAAGGGAAPAAVGWEAGRDSLGVAFGPLRPLETLADVLPEFESAPAATRSLWRHPATIVSLATTVLALAALAVFVVLGALQPHAAATGLALERTSGSIRATWSGPDVPYQLIAVGGPAGDALDLSQLVTGTEAWVPLAADLVDDGSCLIVRPVAGNEDEAVSLEAAALAGQGGASACIADASAASEGDE